MFNPSNWFWLADDARAYGSAKQVITDSSDPDYTAWTDDGYTATKWPRDEAGNQTEAALQDVLTPYGLFANLTYYAASARYTRASGGIEVTGHVYNSDVVSRNTVNSAYNFAQLNPTQTVQWKLADGTFVTLDKAGIETLNASVSEFVQLCFTCESNTVDAINAGTITTRAEVDAAFAAISNVYP
jgi:hypothetical protein